MFVGAMGDGRPFKGSWLTVENQTQCYEKQWKKKKNNKSDSIESRDHKNRSAQMCACPSMSLVAARPENLFLFFFFLFCPFCVLESNIWSSFSSIIMHVAAIATWMFTLHIKWKLNSEFHFSVSFYTKIRESIIYVRSLSADATIPAYSLEHQ